ncbi:MAG: hypothetical protein GY822_00465 [Deltaproteobacteria bacterium]|nr:hypothetical protein [Deltaproteobacteria bacterium]
MPFLFGAALSLFAGCPLVVKNAAGEDAGGAELPDGGDVMKPDGGDVVFLDGGASDAGQIQSLNDAGSFQNDAGSFQNDAGSFQNDAGSFQNDAGSFQNDAGQADAGVAPSAPCREHADGVICDFERRVIVVNNVEREFFLAVPEGTPPSAGWPVMFAFHGTNVPATQFFSASVDDDFGVVHQAQTTSALLDEGVAVLAPQAYEHFLPFFGTYWDTNIPGDWFTTTDHHFMRALLDALQAGELGAFDDDNVFAMGLSSGGYMTSRMSVSYGAEFKGLAIQSASYATCGGAFCSVPELSAAHLPTLFLHGENDAVVPISTMESYAAALDAANVEHQIQRFEGQHEWHPNADEHVLTFLRPLLQP